MTETLSSFAAGTWHTPADTAGARDVRDATNGQLLHRVSSDGIDFTAVADHARLVGLPALQKLTFHQRGVILKQLGAHLMESAKDYHEISFTTGTTKRDAFVDIEGGIGTLFTYSGVARRQMPNSTVLLDGDVERLSKNGTFVGRHILTSRQGLALQINAFNFPVWGMLEKFAPMFVAGVPVVVKPATDSAHLTRAVVADIIASGLLPEGAIQLVTGDISPLFDELAEQDTIAFTGSAGTARRLASLSCVTERGTRFFAEADSLNFSLLGPDAAPGTPEFDLFVDGVIAEMTVKAGQKCTAIRRTFVPAEHAEAVGEALTAKLATVTAGDPRERSTKLGPVISDKQRGDVLDAVDEIVAGGAHLLTGGREASDALAAELGGSFIAPTVLQADDPWVDAVHDIEAFGPVTTLITYSTLAEAVDLAARGRGSLVGSVVTHDPAFAAEFVRSVAPWHGRILVLDRDDAEESTGHGSPLPNLVHGGPGRAGGGEEMGGLRGVTHFMQRTAVQASPDMLTAIGGEWVTGAERHLGDHPFTKSLADLRIGDALESEWREVTLEDIAHFAEFTGDTFYAHTDEEAAAANPFFPGRVAHGYLIVSFAAGLFVQPDPGPVLANYGLEGLRFVTPVSPGDKLKVTLTAKRITPRETDEYGEVRWDAEVVNQDGEPVANYDVLTLVAKE
ncbi:3,4-dehydroadipyl-CoA semialdehyde dehydrogenase [Brevibacterium casei]|uniref:3,4-dehydroadipyl-CoA semialdehyde dehydrogenase n=1 Tax=Brevibacterium casei TaxID=33889 RepID=A0A269ZHQ8_9MICO|nr:MULTISPECIES: phenylacetic acid degradation bifunctional protein PaaZ [Brevibacterium]MCM1013146.1 phenylacetic acid degradation bifunctional protein PaaZ [Brevibacterium sp. XM4083]PAK97342.1 phenylacetic acid degradation bifunctional protein PaaZ [Brevibacterium casei]VEW10894.1 3,4-dehydroadipyl-CoA semialdehyde dehydrogenase [Brevibacterium casei]